jgi:hypothetical protein
MENSPGFTRASDTELQEPAVTLPLHETRLPGGASPMPRLSAEQVSRLRLEALNSLLAGDTAQLAAVSERLCAAGQEVLLAQSGIIDRLASRADLPPGRRARARRVRKLARTLPAPLSSGPLLERSFAYAQAIAEAQSLPVSLPAETLARLIRSQLLVLAVLLAEASKVAKVAPGHMLADVERVR